MSKTAEEWNDELWLYSDISKEFTLKYIKRIQSAARCEALESAATLCENDLPIFQEMRGIASEDKIVLERNEAVRNACKAVRCGLSEDIRALKSKPVEGK